jgi:sulfate transport system permease protein
MSARPAAVEGRSTRALLIAVALGFLVCFLFLPVIAVFVEALRGGAAAYWAAVADEETIAALRLTLLVVLVTVPLNTVFGLAAAWAISRFEFPGKSLLVTLIDLPFAV